MATMRPWASQESMLASVSPTTLTTVRDGQPFGLVQTARQCTQQGKTTIVPRAHASGPAR